MTTAITTNASSTPSRAANVSLWIAQALLAAMFGMSGVMKLMTPIDALAQQMPWVASVPDLLVRFIGLSELAGALGLILPSVTRIRPALTPLAAAGLIVVMVLASGLHISRGETQMVPINLVLGALAAFVAWGRTKKARTHARK